MTFGEIAAPMLLLVFSLGMYVILRIGRNRAVAERDAWRERQAERAASTPAE